MKKYILIYSFIRSLYNNGLRNVIVSLVEDEDADWDDILLNILDAMFIGETGELNESSTST